MRMRLTKNLVCQVTLSVGTVIVVALMLVVFRAWAMPAAPHQGPGVISYQGTLTEPGGQPVDGNVDMTFKLYDVSAGGTALWTEAHAGANAVPVSEGLFNVLLGSLTSIPATVWDHPSLFLEVTAGGEVLAPREAVGSVPYALYALHADLAYNLSAADGDPVHAATVDNDGAVHIEGGGAASVAGGGRLVLGPTSGYNIVLDESGIMARQNGQAATLSLQPEGGNTTVTGDFDVKRKYQVYYRAVEYSQATEKLGPWDLCALLGTEVVGVDNGSADWAKCIIYNEEMTAAWGDYGPYDRGPGDGDRDVWYLWAWAGGDVNKVQCSAICFNLGE